MTFEQLTERCKDRYFDQIVVVVKDLSKQMAAMQRIKKVMAGDVRVCNEVTDPGLATKDGVIAYTEKRATYFYKNIQVCMVEPVAGDTLYQKFLDRFGEGICCVRERVSKDMFDYMKGKFVENNLDAAQTMKSETCEAAWVDLMEDMGIVFGIITEDSAALTPYYTIDETINQVNISTPSAQGTIEKLAKYFEIGPFEMGRQCNSTAHSYGFKQDGVVKPAEFEFYLVMNVTGNIEWEVIQPVKGPLCYTDFLNRRPIGGFHHLLQEIAVDAWEETIKHYEDQGALTNCKGSIGPIDWIYMDTEDELHYYSEMRRANGVMEQLPDGYLMYFWPEPNAK